MYLCDNGNAIEIAEKDNYYLMVHETPFKCPCNLLPPADLRAIPANFCSIIITSLRSNYRNNIIYTLAPYSEHGTLFA